MANPLEYTLDHIHIYCSDIAETERWFVDGMGGELLQHRTMNDSPVTDLRIAGTNLYLFVGSDNASTPETEHLGEEHFGLQVKDLEATAAELKRRGVHFSVEPTQVRPGVKIAFVNGPDNIRIELLQRD